MVLIRKPVERSENIVDARFPQGGARRGLSASRMHDTSRGVQWQKRAYEAMLKREAEAQLQRVRAAMRRGRMR